MDREGKPVNHYRLVKYKNQTSMAVNEIPTREGAAGRDRKYVYPILDAALVGI
jgi:hypothetical protein